MPLTGRLSLAPGSVLPTVTRRNSSRSASIAARYESGPMPRPALPPTSKLSCSSPSFCEACTHSEKSARSERGPVMLTPKGLPGSARLI